MPEEHDSTTRGAGDTPMTRTYVKVVVVEIVIVTLLWVLGRMYR